MRKNFLSMISLVFCMAFFTTVFVACGDDDDDGTPVVNGGGDTPASFSLVGTWEFATTGEDGTFYIETLTFGKDGAFEYETKNSYPYYAAGTTTILTDRWVGKGTYSMVKDGEAKIIITERYSAPLELGKNDELIKDDRAGNDTITYPYFAYGNGMVAGGMRGHIIFYVPQGKEIQLPNMPETALVGKWRHVIEDYNNQSNREWWDTYEFQSDSKMSITSMLMDMENNLQIQGFESGGLFVPLSKEFLLSSGAREEYIPEGSKIFVMVELYSRNYMVDAETGEYKWWPKRSGMGGRPEYYILKDGKLQFFNYDRSFISYDKI